MMKGIGAEVVDALRAFIDADEPEEVWRSHLADDDGRAVTLLDGAGSPHQLDDGQQGEFAPIGEGASAQIVDVPPVKRQAELVEQSRLADARLPADHDDLAATLANPPKTALQHRHLVLAADEDRAGHRPGRRPLTFDQPVPWCVRVSGTLKRKPPLDKAGRGLVQKHAAWARLFQESVQDAPRSFTGLSVHTACRTV